MYSPPALGSQPTTVGLRPTPLIGQGERLQDLTDPLEVPPAARGKVLQEVPLRRFRDPDLKLIATGRRSITRAVKVVGEFYGKPSLELWVTTSPTPRGPATQYLLIDYYY